MPLPTLLTYEYEPLKMVADVCSAGGLVIDT